MMQYFVFTEVYIKKAIDLFREAALRGRLYRLWARLTHRTSRLLHLDEALCCAQVENSHYVGVRPVSQELRKPGVLVSDRAGRPHRPATKAAIL